MLDPCGLAIIEHRLFSEISKNWQGVPLDSYETVMKYIRTSTTATGLKIAAPLDTKPYQTGEEVGEQEMALLNTRAERTLPEWNYTIRSQIQTRK